MSDIETSIMDLSDESCFQLAAITDPMKARRYLRHVGLPYDAPARAPPSSLQGEFECEFEAFPDASSRAVFIGHETINLIGDGGNQKITWMLRRKPACYKYDESSFPL